MANTTKVRVNGEDTSGVEDTTRADSPDVAGDKLFDDEPVEPASVSDTDSGSGSGSGNRANGSGGIDVTSIKRKRGAPFGNKNRTGKSTRATAPAKESGENLTTMLVSLHMMLAALVKTPELEIERSEAQMIGEAINRVNEAYGVVINEKLASTMNLCCVLGAVYGPRAIAIAAKRKKPLLKVMPSAMQGEVTQ